MMPGINVQEFSLPPMADKLKNKNEYSNYSVKYIKANMDEMGDMGALQEILTRSINGSGDIVVLSRDKFAFMDKMFLIVEYLEKRPD